MAPTATGVSRSVRRSEPAGRASDPDDQPREHPDDDGGGHPPAAEPEVRLGLLALLVGAPRDERPPACS